MDCHRRRSTVWNHFKLTEDNKKTQCTLCQTKIAYAGSTSSMKNHLKFRHPTTLESDTADNYKGTTTSTGTSKVQSQLTFGNLNRPMPKGKWQDITKSIVEFCATDIRPLSIVNGAGFRNLVSKLDPSYQVPSHTTIRNYTKYYYESLHSTLQHELNEQTAVALTTDAWTSCAAEGYITITVHYIDKNWLFRHNVLCTSEIHDRHTGDHLSNVLQEHVQKYKISEGDYFWCND